MQQPGWNNNNFGYDTFTSPHRAGPALPDERVRVPRLAGRVVPQPRDRRALLHPAVRAEHEQRRRGAAGAAVPGGRRRHLRRARAPHRVHRRHVHRHELAGAQQQPGLRGPADRRLHRRQLRAGPRFTSCHEGCHAVRGDPAELVPDARRRAGLGGQQHHLQRLAVRQPGPDGRGHRQRRQRATPAVSAWAPATSRSPGPRSPATRRAASWSAACAPTRTTPATSGWSTATSPSATTASTTSAWSTGASSRS